MDDDNDMILGQVAEDRTWKGMVKISAVVDSGAEANALPENVMQWIPLKPNSASKSGKIFSGAGGYPTLRDVREVCDRPNGRGTEPQDCLGSLPSEASSPERCQNHKGWKSSLLGRGQGLVSRTRRRGRSQTSVESATCGCCTCG